MPMLTVRLSDEEMARLKGLAGTGTISALVKRWIAAPDTLSVVKSEVQGRYDMTTVPGRVDVAFDLIGKDMRIAELEAAVAALEGGTDRPTKPGFLAAPDDDCKTCGHDRHAWAHLRGQCQFPTSRRRGNRCLCDDYDLGFE